MTFVGVCVDRGLKSPPAEFQDLFYGDGGFGAADVFEAVVGADGDGVFAGGQIVRGEGVGFVFGIADAVSG